MIDKLREQLAGYSHDAWASWLQYMFGCGVVRVEGDLIIPRDKVERWTRQMTTKYQDLPEIEKPSDREQADRILAITHPTEVMKVIKVGKRVAKFAADERNLSVLCDQLRDSIIDMYYAIGELLDAKEEEDDDA